MTPSSDRLPKPGEPCWSGWKAVAVRRSLRFAACLVAPLDG